MNKSDSERIARVLDFSGYKPASKINGANLIVVNMCSVRQSAVDRVYGKISDFSKLKIHPAYSGTNLKTILTGCILKKDKKKLSKYFDYILDIKDLPKWQIITSKNPSKIRDREISMVDDYLKINPDYLTNFVPIMIGCNNFCAYCVVPYTRGREISRPTDEIVCQVKNLIKHGHKEIWLLGQNVNSYKSYYKNCAKATPNSDGRRNWKSGIETNFPQLLKKINDIPGKFWIRFMSPHPKDFSDELINIMSKCEKLGEYLNLPVQAGDNEILKKMNRHYTVADYKKLVKKIRKKIPNIALSTDVIVGFPGETKKQFENTAKLFREIKFDMAYISKYSQRSGTAAALLKDNVSPVEKKKRGEILTEILKKTALENNKKYIGKTVEVLATGNNIAKTRTNKTVKFQNQSFKPRGFAKVKITDALPWGLKGELKKINPVKVS